MASECLDIVRAEGELEARKHFDTLLYLVQLMLKSDFSVFHNDGECGIIMDGGPGSGNFNHAGRPGLRGGSAPDGGGALPPSTVSVGKLPTAAEIGFQPKTNSEFRNLRDEVVARHRALREQNNLDGLPDCTCDPDTGEMVSFPGGYQVSFQTSISEGTGDGAVSDSDYDSLVNELKKATGSKAYVGVFDEPEISFHCETRK